MNNHSPHIGGAITLGGASGRKDVSYSERVKRIKIRTCECGQKLRGTAILCNDCMDGKEGFDKRMAD